MTASRQQEPMIFEYIQVMLRELYLHRTAVLVCFGVVVYLVLAVGALYPIKFESSSTLHADQQNIIRPLLEGQAEVTEVQDQSRIVSEVIYSPTFMKELVQAVGLVKATDNATQIDKVVADVRKRIQVTGVGSGFIKISYRDSDPAQVYGVVSSIVEIFVRNTSESKRNESRQAFDFINQQVKTYKDQLQVAEDRLKAFNSNNIDGTEQVVSERIAQLRSDIETIKLDLADSNTRARSLEGQLSNESEYSNRRFKTDVYKERLAQAQDELETLLLTYTDTHPQVVEVKHRIEDLNRSIHEARELRAADAGSDTGLNPLYEQLRSQLSTVRVDIVSKQNRLVATEKLLEDEHQRLQRLAERQAELSELTRDYNVTRGIYEDMLERKERARISMTLDIEGQGVNYKVQEPASYPLNPIGLHFIHFAILAPLLGVLIPLGLVFAFIQFDTNIRFVEKLKQSVPVPVLGVVPHVPTKLSERVFKADMLWLLALFVLIVLGYGLVLIARVKGVF